MLVCDDGFGGDDDNDSPNDGRGADQWTMMIMAMGMITMVIITPVWSRMIVVTTPVHPYRNVGTVRDHLCDEHTWLIMMVCISTIMTMTMMGGMIKILMTYEDGMPKHIVQSYLCKNLL